jgi:hypothetical protein
MTRLPNGNLLLMVRVAEALRKPTFDDKVHAIRWDASAAYVLDGWPLELCDVSDPRKFLLHGHGWTIMALTSLSWLLPVELSPTGSRSWRCTTTRRSRRRAAGSATGSRTRGSAGRRALPDDHLLGQPRAAFDHALQLGNALDWTFEGIVLDHQNKDMLIYEG